MEFPNLFPGIDVSSLEEGNDSMAYGRPPAILNVVAWISLTVQSCNRCFGRVGPDHAFLPKAHQDAAMGKRK